jgi:hypothetical protein
MPEITLPSSAEVIAAQDAALARAPTSVDASELHGWIAANHFHNRSLWAQEDLARRTDEDEAHRQACDARLQRLIQQRADLGRCFDELLADARAGRAYFKVYRQFKMYNDPRLNPVLVAEAK